jgi:hypothetical protein
MTIWRTDEDAAYRLLIALRAGCGSKPDPRRPVSLLLRRPLGRFAHTVYAVRTVMDDQRLWQPHRGI